MDEVNEMDKQYAHLCERERYRWTDRQKDVFFKC